MVKKITGDKLLKQANSARKGVMNFLGLRKKGASKDKLVKKALENPHKQKTTESYSSHIQQDHELNIKNPQSNTPKSVEEYPSHIQQDHGLGIPISQKKTTESYPTHIQKDDLASQWKSFSSKASQKKTQPDPSKQQPKSAPAPAPKLPEDNFFTNQKIHNISKTDIPELKKLMVKILTESKIDNLNYNQNLPIIAQDNNSFKKAFRKLSAIHHPDKNPDNVDQAKKNMQNLGIIRDILTHNPQDAN